MMNYVLTNIKIYRFGDFEISLNYINDTNVEQKYILWYRQKTKNTLKNKWTILDSFSSDNKKEAISKFKQFKSKYN